MDKRVIEIIKSVPVPTHFSHRAFSDASGHTWKESNIVIDTAPPIYHRVCVTCGLVQETNDESNEWRDDLTDTLARYRGRIVRAVEQAIESADAPEDGT